MDFPISTCDNHHCLWCNRDNVCEPNSMAILTGGALLMNRKTGDGGPDDRLDGFFDISWHGAHTSEDGVGVSPDCFENLSIVKNVRGGQFDLSFCSTKCLRDFFNHVIDTLEAQVKSQGDE